MELEDGNRQTKRVSRLGPRCEFSRILGDVVSTESKRSRERARAVLGQSEDISPQQMLRWKLAAGRCSPFHSSTAMTSRQAVRVVASAILKERRQGKQCEWRCCLFERMTSRQVVGAATSAVLKNWRRRNHLKVMTARPRKRVTVAARHDRHGREAEVLNTNVRHQRPFLAVPGMRTEEQPFYYSTCHVPVGRQ